MSIIYNGELDKVLYRKVFAETLEEIAAADADMVYLDADLMSAVDTLGFWQRNPRQTINCGIAEGNMLGVAGGLSAMGKKPYLHTFGAFASRRVFDQAFLSVAYAGLSARIFGSDPGICAAFNGGTHMALEDIAMFRAVPKATIIEISCGAMLKNLMWQLKDADGLSYIRFTRKAYPKIYSDDHAFKIGKGEIVRPGDDGAVIACGLMVGEALAAAEILAKKGVNIMVIDMFTIKPLDLELVAKAATTGHVVVAENHSTAGGLGDAVASALLEGGYAPKFTKIGINESFGVVGPQDYLQNFFGLNAENIASKFSK